MRHLTSGRKEKHHEIVENRSAFRNRGSGLWRRLAPAPSWLRRRRPLRNSAVVTHYRTATVDGVSIFYREAGPANGPVVLLLHGFPTSSHMFRNLIPLLADRYHVIAPDYPGFGQSAAPDHTQFTYSFGHYADLVDGLLAQLGATLRDVCHGLRRAGRLPPGPKASRSRQRPDRPERQRL
jgi:hypothetical protein